MSKYTLDNLFGLKGQVAVITGAGGILCSEMARALGELGMKVAILDLREDAAQTVTKEITSAGGQAIAVGCNVLQRASIEQACKTVVDKWKRVDVLINGAGGNKKEATASADLSFFDLPDEAVRFVFELNCIGTLLPSQVFGKQMAEQKSGTVINISSMCGVRPLTRVVGYSAAKAAVVNFTQWLAVHLAQNCSPTIRVNAVAPGFFLTEQNRFLLTDEKTGELTDRGRAIIAHTPASRFGDPDDLISTVVWLLGPGAKFVNGVVALVDGGFSAFSGV